MLPDEADEGVPVGVGLEADFGEAEEAAEDGEGDDVEALEEVRRGLEGDVEEEPHLVHIGTVRQRQGKLG